MHLASPTGSAHVTDSSDIAKTVFQQPASGESTRGRESLIRRWEKRGRTTYRFESVSRPVSNYVVLVDPRSPETSAFNLFRFPPT